MTRIQSQAAFIQSMKLKMERISVKDVNSDELLERIRALEANQGGSRGATANPMVHHELMTRLQVGAASCSTALAHAPREPLLSS